jgi:hypothetical protein
MLALWLPHYQQINKAHPRKAASARIKESCTSSFGSRPRTRTARANNPQSIVQVSALSPWWGRVLTISSPMAAHPSLPYRQSMQRGRHSVLRLVGLHCHAGSPQPEWPNASLSEFFFAGLQCLLTRIHLPQEIVTSAGREQEIENYNKETQHDEPNRCVKRNEDSGENRQQDNGSPRQARRSAK